MLDTKDLELIGGVVKGIVREELDSLMEHQILPQFDLVYDEIGKRASKEDVVHIRKDILGLKNQSATKNFVEDRLDTFAVDHGLKFRPA